MMSTHISRAGVARYGRRIGDGASISRMLLPMIRPINLALFQVTSQTVLEAANDCMRKLTPGSQGAI